MTREQFRHISYVGMGAVKSFTGMGPKGYLVALDFAAEL